MIQAKFGLNWPSGFRGENLWKSLQTDDRRQVMAIAHRKKRQVSWSYLPWKSSQLPPKNIFKNISYTDRDVAFYHEIKFIINNNTDV
jgi:hypothetical protein